MVLALLGAATTSVWTYLLWARGRFWQSGATPCSPAPSRWPAVTAIVPARNEAEHIGQTVQSLLAQTYPGRFQILVVDDASTDATAAIVTALAAQHPRLRVLPGQALAPGWSGKLWAVQQALAQPEADDAAYLLLTDADIIHRPAHLATLVARAEHAGLDLTSEMVRLRTESLAERALIPAFVFFFQLLYPFRWVSDPDRPEAAAAGGTMLVAQHALRRIDGLTRIRTALIDDVSLAREIKRGSHRIALAHTDEATSLRQYPGFIDVTDMVARTAYVQLGHSPWLLAGTVLGMSLVYLAPPALALFAHRRAARLLGAASWCLMATAFQPTLRRYRRSPLWGFALPAIAVFYVAATLTSAARHYRGCGGQWKGRTYPSAAGGTIPSGSRAV